MNLRSFCLLAFLLIAHETIQAQWSPEKVRKKRERLGKQNDSAWSYMAYRVVLVDRYFLGDKKVSRKEYISSMQQADDKVAAFIRQYKTNKLLSLLTGTPGFAMAIISFTILEASLDVERAVAVVFFTGLAAMTTGVVFALISEAKLSKAVRVFNHKAREGTLMRTKGKPVSLNFGVQQHGVGIALRF